MGPHTKNDKITRFPMKIPLGLVSRVRTMTLFRDDFSKGRSRPTRIGVQVYTCNKRRLTITPFQRSRTKETLTERTSTNRQMDEIVPTILFGGHSNGFLLIPPWINRSVRREKREGKGMGWCRRFVSHRRPTSLESCGKTRWVGRTSLNKRYYLKGWRKV